MGKKKSPNDVPFGISPVHGPALGPASTTIVPVPAPQSSVTQPLSRLPALQTAMWTVVFIALVLGSCRAAGPLEPTVDLEGRSDVQETTNTEEQRYKHLLYQIHGTVRTLLDDHQKHIDERIDSLTQLVGENCNSDANGQTNVSDNFTELEPKIEELTNIFFARLTATGEKFVTDIQSKLASVTSDTVGHITLQLLAVADKQDVAVLNHQLANLATSQALGELQQSLSSFASTATEEVKQAIASLGSEWNVNSKSLASSSQVQEIKEQLVTVSSCNHKNDIDQVLALLATAEEDIDSLADTLKTSVAEQKAECQGGADRQESAAGLVQLLESLRTAVDGNANSIRSVASTVGKLEGEVAARLGALEELARKINNNTLLPPPTTTTTTTTPRPTTTTTPAKLVSPCLNSYFYGAVTFDVCDSAVRFKKCQESFMAYHCCRSCTDAGRIPVMGPHRYVQAARRVSTLEALKYF
ncbi:uncharacterized protein LOC125037178 [Penaeus chinensis]|uniref:uncharacterized protein LOC125037178 n=1 Tax=Penaeus chinensis TaxID=139456 RepID=UPI001FB7842B|nr:uncharacterized protein LOC125037178 [Penaeus chinensis]